MRRPGPPARGHGGVDRRGRWCHTGDGYDVFPRELEETLFGVPGAASVMAAVDGKATPCTRLRDVVLIEAIPVSAAEKVLERELAAKGRETRSPTPTGAAWHTDRGGSPIVLAVEMERVGPETEHTGVRLAHEEPSPVRQVWRRVVFAMVLLALTVGVIYLDRDGYRDGDDVGLTLLDSVYYATVTLSTTGYGDITPITPGARLVNILLITPLRITFLLVLIGTTLEALTARSREEFRIRRWRSRVRQHVLVCGYGTKGRSAIRSLQALGTPLDKIVVVDPDARAIDEANSIGLTGIVGDAGRTEVLRRASVERARAVIVAANRDDAAVLITLTVRQLNPNVPITTSVREEENANLLRQSGADTVITTSATSGRLLGLSTDAPRVVAVVEDLVTGGQGLDLHQRRVTSSEVGLDSRSLRDIVLSVTRGGRTLRFDDPLIGTLEPEDELVVVRSHH